MSMMTKKCEAFYKSEIKRLLEGKNFDLAKLNQQSKILYGTFGYHDSEPPHSIIFRKLLEVNENPFGLWGIKIEEKYFNRIKDFCKSNGEEIYFFMKFTRNLVQNKTEEECDKHIWSLDKVFESNYYTDYIDENGTKIPLDPKQTKIIVKGDSQQNTALVVEDYYIFSNEFKRNRLLSFYEGTLYSSEEKENANVLCTQATCYLLERKLEEILDTSSITESVKDDDWAIILKLKYPYLVKCVR